MNQRIQVRSLIKKDGRILLLKRAVGREDQLGKFELPGGRVGTNEQPEDAAARLVREAAGLEMQSSFLSDVLTYVDSHKTDIQYAVIMYTASVAGGKEDIQLGQKYNRYAWKKPSDIKAEELTELSRLLIAAYGERPGVSTSVDIVKIKSDVSYSKKRPGGIVIYSDGGSRGNPGQSAAGYVIKDSDDNLVYEGGAYLGITTNNQAEYHGVRLGLEKAKELGARHVECYVDSMLVVNQLNGSYVVRNRELWPIHERIKELIGQFDKVAFYHVKREFNREADGMVNKILDARANKNVSEYSIL